VDLHDRTLDWTAARRLRRNLRLPLALLAGSALGYLYASEVRTSSLVWGAAAAVMLPILALLIVVRNALPRAVPTRVRLTAEALEIEGRAPIAPVEISELRLLPRPGRHGDAVVDMLTVNGERERLWMMADGARNLTDALGPRRARFRLALPFAPRFFGALALVAIPSLALGVLTHAPAVGIFALSIGAIFWALVLSGLLWFIPGSVTVGADGVTTRWLAFRRFVSFRDVVAVDSRRARSDGRADTVLALKSGRRLRLIPRETPDTEADRGLESIALASHVISAHSAWQATFGSATDLARLVAPSAEVPSAWRLALDALVHGTGYRSTNLNPDRLFSLLGDPTVDRRARVGAAAALVRIGDDESRARVRVAAASSADAALRDAMLAVADSDSDEAMDRALARVLR